MYISNPSIHPFFVPLCCLLSPSVFSWSSLFPITDHLVPHTFLPDWTVIATKKKPPSPTVSFSRSLSPSPSSSSLPFLLFLSFSYPLVASISLSLSHQWIIESWTSIRQMISIQFILPAPVNIFFPFCHLSLLCSHFVISPPVWFEAYCVCVCVCVRQRECVCVCVWKPVCVDELPKPSVAISRTPEKGKEGSGNEAKKKCWKIHTCEQS